MLTDNLYERFVESGIGGLKSNEFEVIPFADGSPHWLGVDEDRRPVFFISTADEAKPTGWSLKYIKVTFNERCRLRLSEHETSEGKYSVLRLLSGQRDLVRHFIEIFVISISSLPERPTTREFESLVKRLIALFAKLGTCSLAAVQGLWAEMFVMTKSSSPSVLVHAWHTSPIDKFDFNDGHDKIEVKSSANIEKRHSFALEQLTPGPSSRLIVASVAVVKCSDGLCLRDLEDVIAAKLNGDLGAIEKLKSIIVQTLGCHAEEENNSEDDIVSTRFDASLATDTLAFFDSCAVPSISPDAVPAGVTNVHFVSDLNGIEEYNFVNTDSQLFKALGYE